MILFVQINKSDAHTYMNPYANTDNGQRLVILSAHYKLFIFCLATQYFPKYM